MCFFLNASFEGRFKGLFFENENNPLKTPL